MAKAFSPKLAMKATYLEGTDWYAVNYDDKTRAGLDRKALTTTMVLTFMEMKLLQTSERVSGFTSGRKNYSAYNVFRSILKFNSK
jgi:hypothetical protein